MAKTQRKYGMEYSRRFFRRQPPEACRRQRMMFIARKTGDGAIRGNLPMRPVPARRSEEPSSALAAEHSIPAKPAAGQLQNTA